MVPAFIVIRSSRTPETKLRRSNRPLQATRPLMMQSRMFRAQMSNNKACIRSIDRWKGSHSSLQISAALRNVSTVMATAFFRFVDVVSLDNACLALPAYVEVNEYLLVFTISLPNYMRFLVNLLLAFRRTQLLMHIMGWMMWNPSMDTQLGSPVLPVKYPRWCGLMH